MELFVYLHSGPAEHLNARDKASIHFNPSLGPAVFDSGAIVGVRSQTNNRKYAEYSPIWDVSNINEESLN